MISRTSILACGLGLVAAGCVASGADDADDEAGSSFTISMPATDVVRVLDLVNYPGTDLARLDHDAGLDARAAAGIIKHRDGADGAALTGDDDLFGDLAELDAVPYVGDSALRRLLASAIAHPAPIGEQVEGVTFAGWQTEAVVWGVNHATTQELDVDAALDVRAARALVASAPYAHVSSMGPIAYVGTAALTALRARAPQWWTKMHGITPPCQIALATRTDAAVESFTRLLDLATTLDYPSSEATALQISACAVADPTLPDVLRTTPLIDDGYDDSVHPTAQPPVRGGTSYINWVNSAGDAIRDRISEGAWTPANADEQALLDSLPSLITTLTDAPRLHPERYTEVLLEIDADECSSWGSVLIEQATGKLTVIYKFPGC